MKNCLIVLAVLIGCFAVAVFLVYAFEMNFGRGHPGGLSLEVAQWRDYDDQDIVGLEVDIFPDRIIVDVPATPVFKQIIAEGHWNAHAFYSDSHLDSPPEVEVARELRNEDLEFDVGRFLPKHPGKVTLVKVMRGQKDDDRPAYPVVVPGQSVPYPPPRGLIRVGMLECDLQMLPWRADRIDCTPLVVNVDVSALSDGKKNENYFPPYANTGDNSSMVYNYHSDRADAPKLLVTVYHGRVIQVVGGAEETADIPYQLPPSSPPAEEEGRDKKEGWGSWLSDLFFKK